MAQGRKKIDCNSSYSDIFWYLICCKCCPKKAKTTTSPAPSTTRPTPASSLALGRPSAPPFTPAHEQSQAKSYLPGQTSFSEEVIEQSQSQSIVGVEMPSP